MAIQVDDARELVAMADAAKNVDLEYIGDDTTTLDGSMIDSIDDVVRVLCTRTTTTFVSKVCDLYPLLY